jgi:hypothetical protein
MAKPQLLLCLAVTAAALLLVGERTSVDILGCAPTQRSLIRSDPFLCLAGGVEAKIYKKSGDVTELQIGVKVPPTFRSPQARNVWPPRGLGYEKQKWTLQ